MNEAEVLEAAADYIEEHGWWDGTEETHGYETVCAVEAICKVETRSAAINSDAIPAMRKWLGVDCLAEWNDEQHQERVVKELRACAADLRERTHA